MCRASWTRTWRIPAALSRAFHSSQSAWAPMGRPWADTRRNRHRARLARRSCALGAGAGAPLAPPPVAVAARCVRLLLSDFSSVSWTRRRFAAGTPGHGWCSQAGSRRGGGPCRRRAGRRSRAARRGAEAASGPSAFRHQGRAAARRAVPALAVSVQGRGGLLDLLERCEVHRLELRVSGGAAGRPRGGGLTYGRKPPGRGAAAAPHPQAGGTAERPEAAPARWRAVLRSPGSLSPAKAHHQGRACGASLARWRDATLDSDLCW